MRMVTFSQPCPIIQQNCRTSSQVCLFLHSDKALAYSIRGYWLRSLQDEDLPPPLDHFPLFPDVVLTHGVGLLPSRVELGGELLEEMITVFAITFPELQDHLLTYHVMPAEYLADPFLLGGVLVGPGGRISTTSCCQGHSTPLNPSTPNHTRVKSTHSGHHSRGF